VRKEFLACLTVLTQHRGVTDKPRDVLKRYAVFIRLYTLQLLLEGRSTS